MHHREVREAYRGRIQSVSTAAQKSTSSTEDFLSPCKSPQKSPERACVRAPVSPEGRILSPNRTHKTSHAGASVTPLAREAYMGQTVQTMEKEPWPLCVGKLLSVNYADIFALPDTDVCRHPAGLLKKKRECGEISTRDLLGI